MQSEKQLRDKIKKSVALVNTKSVSGSRNGGSRTGGKRPSTLKAFWDFYYDLKSKNPNITRSEASEMYKRKSGSGLIGGAKSGGVLVGGNFLDSLRSFVKQADKILESVKKA